MRSFRDFVLWRRAQELCRRHQPHLVAIAGSSQTSLVKLSLAKLLEADHPFYLETPPLRPSDVALAILGLSHPQPDSFSLIKLVTGSRLREIASPSPKTIILELPSSRPGYLDDLAQRLAFDFVVLTNIQTTNLSYFSDLQALAHELTSLLTLLPPTASAVLNFDDPLLKSLTRHTRARVFSVGQARENSLYLRRLTRLGFGLVAEVILDKQPYEIHLPHLVYSFQVQALLESILVASKRGVNLPAAIARLQSLQPPAGHYRLQPTYRGSHLIDASAGATFEELQVALDALGELPAKRRIALLSGLSSLGSRSSSIHRQLGQQAAKACDLILTVGEEARPIASAALASGQADVHRFIDAPTAGKWLRSFLKPQDLVFIAGAPESRLSQVVTSLQA